MRIADRVKTGQRAETGVPDDDISGAATYEHASRKMTFAENVILTIKVLAGFGLLGAALWGISLWKSA